MATRPDDSVIQPLYEQGLSDQQISQQTPYSRWQVQRWRDQHQLVPNGGNYGRFGQRGVVMRAVSETPERTIYAPNDIDEEPFEKLLERAKEATSRDVRKAISRRFCRAEIVSSQPIGISIASDQHLTMHGPCDVTRAFEDAELMRDTSGLFTLLGGDGVDNHIRIMSAMVSKGSRPTDEYRLYDGYLRTLGNKVLAMISGNHDDWTPGASGIDHVGILASRNKIHYASDVVLMTIAIVPETGAEPTQEYAVKVRHQYRFNSSLNLLHVVKRMYDLDGDQFDIGICCHNHEAEVGTFNRHGASRWGARPGAYQVESAWSRQKGFGYAYPTCPTFVLWPSEHRIEGFEDLRGGTEKLASVRSAATADAP